VSLPYTHFALFRLPEQTDCELMAQTEGEPQTVESVADLSGLEGFVMAPFSPDDRHPIVLLRPDIRRRLEAPAPQPTATGSATVLETDADRQHYHLDFANFHAQILAGSYHKLVLSRCQRFTSEAPLPALQLFATACQLYPHQFIALVSSPLTGTWLMATPEVLLSGDGSTWSTMALAGTQPLGLRADTPEALSHVEWSVKNHLEQQYVTTYITEILEHYADDIARRGPYTSMAARLLHLRTDFTFSLPHPERLGDLLNDLFPTPAVCGVPKEAARKFILENESVDRRYYSGFCGPLDPTGATHLFVSLRCMQIADREATLYAGGGLLPESEEDSEWAETEAKLQTMKRLFGLPATKADRPRGATGKAAPTAGPRL
jgi:isochorismate synthase